MPSKTSPYSTSFVQGDIDYDLDPTTQMRIFKREEKETHIGPNTLPYEMGQLPEYFGAMVDNGFQACKTMEAVLKTKNIKDKEDLYKLMRNTEKIILYLVKTVDTTLEKYTIGEKHRDDGPDYEDEMYNRS